VRISRTRLTDGLLDAACAFANDDAADGLIIGSGHFHNYFTRHVAGCFEITLKLLILLERRDVRVVEGARLESDSGQPASSNSKTPPHLIGSTISRYPMLSDVTP
jgi:hypothetical protein